MLEKGFYLLTLSDEMKEQVGRRNIIGSLERDTDERKFLSFHIGWTHEKDRILDESYLLVMKDLKKLKKLPNREVIHKMYGKKERYYHEK